MTSKQKPPGKRRVLIVDNHPLVRRGLTTLIDHEPDLVVCATTSGPETAVAAIAAHHPDLVITDLALEDNNDGLELVRYIRSTDVNLPVLVLTMHALPHYADLALQAGANGYILKQEMTETLLIAIRHVLSGQQYIQLESGGDHEIH